MGGVLETDKNRVDELKIKYPEYKFFTDIDLAFGNSAKVVGWINEKGHKLVFDKHGRSKCN